MYATLAWFQEQWGWEWDSKSLRYSYKNWHVTEGYVPSPTDTYLAPEDDYKEPESTEGPTPVEIPNPQATSLPSDDPHDELRRSEQGHDELRNFEA